MKQRRSFLAHFRHSARARHAALGSSIAALLSLQVVRGVTLTWDANAAAAGQTVGARARHGASQWWDGSANTTWVDGSDAVFGNGGAGGAVTLAGPTTVNSLPFNSFSGPYTLGTAGQAITVKSGLTINSAAAAVTVVSPVTLGGSQSFITTAKAAGGLSTGGIFRFAHGVTTKTIWAGSDLYTLTLANSANAESVTLALRSVPLSLTASDGAANDEFGNSVSLAGTIGLVGAQTKNSNQGAAYVFRNLDTATGTVTEDVKLTASDGAAYDYFGYAVSQSGTIGLVGAFGKNSYQGAAYVFRNLDTATGTVHGKNVELTASDGAAYDYFGYAVSQSGTSGLVGAPYKNSYQGAAYVFRNLDTASGTVIQNVELTASDGAADDEFGASVSQSGTIGLVGADGKNSYQGAAYVFPQPGHGHRHGA